MRTLHDATEGDARRTRRLAGTTDEAGLEMIPGRLGRGALGLDEPADELDPPARRVGLFAEDPIRRAIVEAKTAGNARREVLATHVGWEDDVPSIRTMAVGTAGIASRLREVIASDRRARPGVSGSPGRARRAGALLPAGSGKRSRVHARGHGGEQRERTSRRALGNDVRVRARGRGRPRRRFGDHDGWRALEGPE